MHRIPQHIATFALIILTLTACTTAAPSDAKVSSQSRVAIDALINQPPELRAAAYDVARKCMQSYGFALPPTAIIQEGYLSPSGVVGLFPSISEAKLSGYASTIKAGGDPVDLYRASLSHPQQESFDRAYAPESSHEAHVTLSNGMRASRSTDGCNAEGQEAVYGSVKTALEIDMFINDLLSAGNSDAVQQAARENFGAYKSCMSQQEFSVTKLGAGDIAHQLLGAYRQPGEPPSVRESEIAAADAGCQKSSGLLKAIDSAYYRSAALWVANHEGHILGLQERLKAAQLRAKGILENE